MYSKASEQNIRLLANMQADCSYTCVLMHTHSPKEALTDVQQVKAKGIRTYLCIRVYILLIQLAIRQTGVA